MVTANKWQSWASNPSMSASRADNYAINAKYIYLVQNWLSDTYSSPDTAFSAENLVVKKIVQMACPQGAYTLSSYLSGTHYVSSTLPALEGGSEAQCHDSSIQDTHLNLSSKASY